MTAVNDPITREVVRNALISIADMMAWTVVRTARSAVIKDGMDFSTALFTADGDQVAQGLTLPAHLGSMVYALESIMQRFEGDIAVDDVFAINDPYEGGSHLPDVFLFKPIFIENEHVAWACAIGHQTDMGGRVAGGIACDSTDVFQEGLTIPPLKLVEKGRLNQAVWRIIEKNVRVPDQVLADLTAQLAAVRLADRELHKLAKEYGKAELVAYMSDIIESTEKLTRAAIQSLPKGEWTFVDYLDNDFFDDEPLKIQVKMTILDDEVHFDFSGTSPQAKGSINPTLAYTKTQVFSVMKCLIDPEIPSNSGFYRPFKVHAPEGTLVNPQRPGAVGGRGMTGLRVDQVVFGALALALPGQVPAAWGGGEFCVIMSGYDADRKPWLHLDIITDGPRGGGPSMDGADGLACPVNNMSVIPVETIESELPLRIERFGFLPDTGGAGKYRGGLGLVRDIRVLASEATFQLRSDRTKFLPWGLEGGRPGAPTMSVINPDQESRAIPGKTSLVLRSGDLYRMIQAGGGGYGDPLEREIDAVIRDLKEEKISTEHAKREYGVIVDPMTNQARMAETERLREEMRRSRGPLDCAPTVARRRNEAPYMGQGSSGAG